jgi:ferritin
MKDLLRLKSSLTAEVEALLNEQIQKEAHSSSLYLAMASWCDRNGFDKSAEYFYKQSDEERQHMLRIFKYVSDLGGTAISPTIDNIKLEFNSFREVFEDALEQEIAITQSFNNIADRCLRLKDFMTMQFLDWFLREQREEEYVARRAVELFDVIGEEGTGRWEIDRHVGKIKYDSEPEG